MTAVVKHGGPRVGAGRPRRKLTEAELKQIEGMAAVGCTRRQIAHFLKIDEAHLTTLADDLINTAKSKAIAKVAQSLYVAATEKDDRTAQIFFLKSQAGWRDQPQPEASGLLNIHLHLG